jgi:hypothetical protein
MYVSENVALAVENFHHEAVAETKRAFGTSEW